MKEWWLTGSLARKAKESDCLPQARQEAKSTKTRTEATGTSLARNVERDQKRWQVISDGREGKENLAEMQGDLYLHGGELDGRGHIDS
jgi:hypothetical protein